MADASYFENNSERSFLKTVAHIGSLSSIHPNASTQEPAPSCASSWQPEGNSEVRKTSAPGRPRLARATAFKNQVRRATSIGSVGSYLEWRKEIRKLEGRDWLPTIIAVFVIFSIWLDALNRPLVTTYADGSTTQQAYTSTGFKWQVTDENGNKTQTAYDNAGRPVEVIGATVNDGHGNEASPVTQSFYDAAGDIAETVNPLGQKWDYVYDARDRKLQELDPPVLDAVSNTTLRPTRVWEYDAAGRAIAAIDPKGNETDTSYDPANRVTDVLEPAVSVSGGGTARPDTHSTYDLDGNVLTLTDPNNHATTNTYDLLNRLLTTTDAANITVTNTYDADGNKIAVEDGRNQTTTFAYDGLKRNTAVIDAAGDTTRLQYDGLNKVQRIDALGQTTTYIYDVRNRLSNVVYASGAAANSPRNYTCDNDGNILSVAEPAKSGAADVGYTYDALNRVATETSSGLTHSYLYDLAGNRLTTTYGGTGLVLSCTYDALNRLSTLTEEGRTTTYGYDLNGNVMTQQFPNGDIETTAFDALNRRTEIATAVSAGNLSQFNLTYDLKGNLLNQQETYFTSSLANRTVGINYDAIDRLQGENITQGTVTLSTTYAYDGANNRTSRVVTGGSNAGTTSYTYNNLNQLTAWSGPAGSATYGYDADGNRTSSSLGSTTYGYDDENRLVSTTQSGTNYQYVYDYRTRRVNRTEGGAATTVVFSGGVSIAEYSGTGASPTVEYLRGSDWGGGVGGILYTLRGSGAATTMGVTHYDGRGDVVAKTNGSGVLTYQASYEAFGKRSQEYGSTLDRQKANTKEEDPTGLMLEGLRYTCLDGGLRVFMTQDPAGMVDGPNLYTYVNQNPWTKFDPEGLYAPPMAHPGQDWSGTESDIQKYVVPAMNMGAAFVPGVSQVQSLQTLRDPNASVFDKVVAVVGMIPEVGGIVKDVGVVAKDVEVVGKEVVAVEKTAAATTKEAEQTVAKEIKVDYDKHPEAAQHIDDAQAAGHPDVVTVDKPNAKPQRQAATGDVAKVPGKQLDEYPPAFSKEGGKGASVRPISPADNMGAGAAMGNQIRDIPDGAKVRIITINKPPGS